MKTYTIWRPCAHCGAQFGQPNDPGRKRRYCTDACKQAAYRARKRASHEHARRTREREEEARRRRRYEEHQRQQRAREEEARRREQRSRTYQPPPHSGNGYRADTAEQARAPPHHRGVTPQGGQHHLPTRSRGLPRQGRGATPQARPVATIGSSPGPPPSAGRAAIYGP